MNLTEQKIKQFTTDEYREHRKDIKQFYENLRFCQQMKRKSIKKERKKEEPVVITKTETEKNDIYYKSHEDLKYLQKFKNCPWKAFLQNAISRCECKGNISYIDYGFIGIQCLITEEEVKELWFRDEAYLMEKPSIDRKDSLFHYTYDNCQFIELVDNTIRAKKMQYYTRYCKKLKITDDWTKLEKLNEIKMKIDVNFEKIRQKCPRREDLKK